MIRALTQFHENERLAVAAATPGGRVLLWVLASALLVWHVHFGPAAAGGRYLYIVIGALLAATLFPSHRRMVLGVASLVALAMFFRNRDMRAGVIPALQFWDAYALDWVRFAVLMAAILCGLYATVFALRQFPRLPGLVRRYPVLALHAGVWMLLLTEPALGAPTVIREVLSIAAWRLSYLVQFASRGLMVGTRFADHLFYLWPAYGPQGVGTPVGKGLEFLSRHEARDDGALARSRLAGLKLLILATLWEIVRLLADAFAYGDARSTALHWVGGTTLGLPRLHQMMDGQLTSTTQAIANLYLELLLQSLYIAIYGHIIVGCLRLFGFNVFRHAYRPLLSTSIVEFWGRWSYYYKELLTEFFFYPIFLRTPWAGPRLRLFLAVFAAAAVGNMYFVILSEVHLLLEGDTAAMWSRWGSRSVYCVLLALGIWVSMLRQQRSRGRSLAPPGGWSRYRSAFLVCSFYALAHIWNIAGSSLGPLERLAWLIAVVAP